MQRNGHALARRLAQTANMRDYRRIKAWQRAHSLAVAVHKLTKHFGRKGYSRLKAQLTEAADSIGANIVEGCGAATNKDFARFLDNSVKSANETEYHLLCARDFELIDRKDWNWFTTETIEVRKMIYTYRRRVVEDDRKN